jgi:hypothetical protein
MGLEPIIRDGTRVARIGRMFTDFILRNAKEKDLTTKDTKYSKEEKRDPRLKKREKDLITTLEVLRASLEELRAGSTNPLRGQGDSKGKDKAGIVTEIIQNKCSIVKHRGVRGVSGCTDFGNKSPLTWEPEHNNI